ncbi:MAG: GNAT family N-acetyltransferase [Pseudolysinimonas sp.]
MIRAAMQEDLPAIALLRWRWVTEMSGGMDESGRDEFLRALVSWADAHSTSHFCFVADNSAGLVGMAWLALAPRLPSPGQLDRRNGEIQSVYVVPELRNSGIGGQLISLALTTADAYGVERTIVHSSESAVASYERAGFAASTLLLER